MARSSKSDNLETYSLILLSTDSDSNNDFSTVAENLRSIINHLLIFNDELECQKYIENGTEEKIILVISADIMSTFLPLIHDLVQVLLVYIFDRNEQDHSSIMKNFKKIKTVVKNKEELVEMIKINNKQLRASTSSINLVIEDLIPKQQSTNELNSGYLYMQLLIDVLIKMKYTPDAKKELADLCRTQYQGNPGELYIIDEFESDYTPEKVFWWYTRECFIYRLLNKALRTRNIDVLCSFYFIIGDIYRQLLKMQQTYFWDNYQQDGRLINVFRGQCLAHDEMQELQANIGKCITLNSFLSTTHDRRTSISFANSGPSDLIPVLFEILANNRVSGTTKPFADISKLSFVREEQEVLFMLGSVFQIISVHFDTVESIWIVKLFLTTIEDTSIIKVCIDYELSHLPKEVHFESIAKFLSCLDMDEKAEQYYDKAERYHKNFIENYPIDDITLANSYSCLSWIARTRGYTDEELNYYLKARSLDINTTERLESHISIQLTASGLII